jgi:hypothetical protein
MSLYFSFVIKNGLALDDNYPYIAKQGKCQPYSAAVRIDDGWVLPKDENILADYLFANGPFAIGWLQKYFHSFKNETMRRSLYSYTVLKVISVKR